MAVRLFLIVLLGLNSIFTFADAGRYAPSSVLSEGKWVKIQVESTGMYKLTYPELQQMGFADPSKVSVFGYGGQMLEEDFSKPFIDDLPQIPVWREADHILFYAQGAVKWVYDSASGTFVHTNNPYSSYGYYFLTDAAGIKAMEKTGFSGDTQQEVSVFDDYLVHEEEIASVNRSGRELFGESFESRNTHTFTKSIPGIVNLPGKVALRFVARPERSPGPVVMTIDSETIVNGSIAPTDNTYTKAVALQRTSGWNGEKKESVQIQITYGLSSDPSARLDYFRLQMQRELRPYGASTSFRSIASIGKATRFTVKEANSNTLIFDVTDGINPVQMETVLNGSELSFSIPGSFSLREFVIVQKESTFAKPAVIGEVRNQNLHALSQTDMVIIAPESFARQAERLADAHRNPDRDGLSVIIADPQQIYNEFSSGTPDATAYRRFMKMFYDRSSSSPGTTVPKYLLLFGDGMYDNRGLTAEGKTILKEFGDNLLLTYQSGNSLDLYSYVTDDYYGLLDDHEGKDIKNDNLDLGIGRLPVRTQTEATQVVDKLISYMNNTQYGAWKNNILLVADDGSKNDSNPLIHMDQAEKIAVEIENNHPDFMVSRIYFDAYKKDVSTGQGRYPDVNARIQRMLKDGVLIINYTGHGDTRSWSEERVMTDTDIRQAAYQKLPLWITATCDFTRFDDVTTSAGEEVLMNKTSGGIALITTTRVVISQSNFNLNIKLNQLLYSKTDGKYRTLGEAIKDTKNSLPNDNNKLNFILIGDPAMRLAYPEYRTVITSINGKPVNEETPTLKALEKVTVEGEVRTSNGERVPGFNGVVVPSVMDKKDRIATLNNTGRGVFTFSEYHTKLFTGYDEVADGSFSFTFTMPKDISYSNEYGKMFLYAYDEEGGAEANGAYAGYKVGGSAENPEKDEDSPEIRQLYLNDTTFTDSGKVNSTPLFVARIWDKSGVNISGSSIGHDMMLVIDGKPAQSYILNSNYESVIGGEGEGIVTYILPELAPGIHKAEFIVWDILNNSTRKEFSFEVVEGLKPSLIELVGTPNPARQHVEFYLSHNRPETVMNVTIRVYDLTGRLLWSHEERGSSEVFKSYIVTWDLTDNSGTRLRPGVYIYRAGISANGSKEATKANKIIVLAQ